MPSSSHYQALLCRSYYDLLCGYQLDLPPPATKDMSPEIYLSHVRKFVLQRAPKMEQKIDQIIDNVKRMARAQTPHPSYFEWFEKDTKACFWVWYQLRIATLENNMQLSGVMLIDNGNIFQSGNNSPSPSRYNTQVNASDFSFDFDPAPVILYDQLYLPPYPASHSTRLEIINFLLFSWKETSIEKETYLTRLQSEWHQFHHQKDIFSFLTPENKEDCEWVWGYLKKHNMTPSQLLPINKAEEYYCAIYTAYYHWYKDGRSEFEIKLFEHTFSNAKGQYLYRDKSKEKKAINIRISKNAKEQLEHIVLNRGISQAKVIEWAISLAYKSNLEDK